MTDDEIKAIEAVAFQSGLNVQADKYGELHKWAHAKIKELEHTVKARERTAKELKRQLALEVLAVAARDKVIGRLMAGLVSLNSDSTTTTGENT